MSILIISALSPRYTASSFFHPDNARRLSIINPATKRFLFFILPSSEKSICQMEVDCFSRSVPFPVVQKSGGRRSNLSRLHRNQRRFFCIPSSATPRPMPQKASHLTKASAPSLSTAESMQAFSSSHSSKRHPGTGYIRVPFPAYSKDISLHHPALLSFYHHDGYRSRFRRFLPFGQIPVLFCADSGEPHFIRPISTPLFAVILSS